MRSHPRGHLRPRCAVHCPPRPGGRSGGTDRGTAAHADQGAILLTSVKGPDLAPAATWASLEARCCASPDRQTDRHVPRCTASLCTEQDNSTGVPGPGAAGGGGRGRGAARRASRLQTRPVRPVGRSHHPCSLSALPRGRGTVSEASSAPCGRLSPGGTCGATSVPGTRTCSLISFLKFEDKTGFLSIPGRSPPRLTHPGGTSVLLARDAPRTLLGEPWILGPLSWPSSPPAHRHAPLRCVRPVRDRGPDPGAATPNTHDLEERTCLVSHEM